MKVLVVRFSSIGDIVLTTPIVRALKKQVEDIEIHYLTKKSFHVLLNNNPYIDKLITIEKEIDEVIDLLKKEQYDYIIDLHKNLRTKRLKIKLKRPSFSFNKLNWEKWKLVKLKINSMPKLHIVDRYFEAVEPLGVKNDGERCDYFIPLEDEVNIIHEFSFTEFQTIAIGAQFKTKRMPKELLLQLIEKINMPIILLGGEMDANLAHEIIDALPNKKVKSACGGYNLNQSASIVKQSKRLITNDTGMMHIASCFGVKITSVWGNTVPDLGMYPYYPDQPEKFTIHEVKGLNCRPCSKIGYQECPKGHFNCMKQQNVEEIIPLP